MPFFNDDVRGRATTPMKPEFTFPTAIPSHSLHRRDSEESIRTELCEGLVSDELTALDTNPNPIEERGQNSRPNPEGITDRAELIERLKRGESPTWVPSRRLDSSFQLNRKLPSHTSNRDLSGYPSLLPAADIVEQPHELLSTDDDTMNIGLTIERPRSALHSGDFTEPQSNVKKDSFQGAVEDSNQVLFGSNSPWLSTSPPRHFTPFPEANRFSPSSNIASGLQVRSRAPSLSSSLSSSFKFRPPTSPLARSESNDDFDFSSSINSICGHERDLESSQLGAGQASIFPRSIPFSGAPPSFERQPPSLRRDSTFPFYQAHQPRRSLNWTQDMSQTQSTPQTPSLARSRRPSNSSDCSPLQHASMVGSYEESILHGRMSTTPSRPLDFVAQIGVLGRGKCKPSLRCPAHVTIPFPAVFYSYSNTAYGRSGRIEDGPSPYVGLIDLENGLKAQDQSNTDKRKRCRVASDYSPSADTDMAMFEDHINAQTTEHDRRRAQKQKRRSTSPKAPPGGSYRIPEKGQLQIIIKNPNKTAVKLFLVPYDLAGMEAGTKTFIRQISYSSGPIIEPAVSSPPLKPKDTNNERQTLRYLLHLHICSPFKGRFYLYKSIRVVFANRVPDGKESLRNEIKWPEPKWSVYKPVRESLNGGLGHGGPGATLAAEKAYRRQSLGSVLSLSHRVYNEVDEVAKPLYSKSSSGLTFLQEQNANSKAVEPLPFSLFPDRLPTRLADGQMRDVTMEPLSPSSSKSSRPPTSQESGLPGSWSSNGPDLGGYDKLNKGDVGYGGNAFLGLNNGKQASSEGLLALKLRSLGVGNHQLE